MLFDSRTVYLGASRDKYEQYCKALDSEKIKYKTKSVMFAQFPPAITDPVYRKNLCLNEYI